MLQRGLGFAAEDSASRGSKRRAGLMLQRGLGFAAEERHHSVVRWRGALRVASTGPRLRSRGERSADARDSMSHAGFNGASASQPRRGSTTTVERLLSSWMSLQRGLGFVAEDGRDRPTRDVPSARASAGPRLRSRGHFRPAVEQPEAVSFNGASASQPRRARPGVADEGCRRGELQRGLGFVAEDGWSREPRDAAASAASTGPRLRSRGEANEVGQRLRRSGLLQRGLGFVAEDGPKVARRASLGRFSIAGAASTGPRLRCRGWSGLGIAAAVE